MRIKLIACKVMEQEVCSVMERNSIHYDTEFLELGFHNYPDKLHTKLQSVIDNSRGYDRILLGFGLCGMAAVNLHCKDTLVIIPNVHDCTPVLLGSKERFVELHHEETGTFYMARGFLEDKDGFIEQYETWQNDYGNDSAEILKEMYYGSYKRLLYIDRPCPQAAVLRTKAIASANFMNLEYGETEAKDNFLEKIILGPWDDPELFINLAPQDRLTEHHFGL